MTFEYRSGALCAEQVPLEEIARRFGTPSYVYSRAAIEARFGEFARALAGHASLIAYSVKANSNLAVLAVLARLGAGFDIVSGGELARVLAAGGDARKILFSGVGKTEDEIARALDAKVLCLNLESEMELHRVAAIAKHLGKRAPIAFRVNPDVDAKTHPYISTGLKQSKFGVPYEDAERLYREAAGTWTSGADSASATATRHRHRSRSSWTGRWVCSQAGVKRWSSTPGAPSWATPACC